MVIVIIALFWENLISVSALILRQQSPLPFYTNKDGGGGACSVRNRIHAGDWHTQMKVESAVCCGTCKKCTEEEGKVCLYIRFCWCCLFQKFTGYKHDWSDRRVPVILQLSAASLEQVDNRQVVIASYKYKDIRQIIKVNPATLFLIMYILAAWMLVKL